ERRCLIPVSAWAEAQGAKGAKTRTWMSRPDAELFAVAGVWRESDEFGLCYSMVMTDSAGSASADVHSRMPVLLRPEDYDRWVSGSPDDAKTLCTAWTGELRIDQTEESWVRGAASQKNLL
ncbi:MAG: SOS response-associated peptidase family protein, partial [Pseudomonadota bacterium]|nr:SOS response-associated peptidase family protein [Pseudomonadota bacterium]